MLKLNFSYQGYDNYTADLTAVVAPISLTVNCPSGYNEDTVDITATLTDTTQNTPIANKSATITVNSQIYTANTDNFGQITWNYFINNMATQDYNIAVSFTGDTQHAASNGTGTLTVDLIPITITVENVRGNKDETVTLSAVLVDHHGNL